MHIGQELAARTMLLARGSQSGHVVCGVGEPGYWVSYSCESAELKK